MSRRHALQCRRTAAEAPEGEPDLQRARVAAMAQDELYLHKVRKPAEMQDEELAPVRWKAIVMAVADAY